MQKLEFKNNIPAISFENVGVFYKKRNKNLIKSFTQPSVGFWALKDISFQINKGDVLGLIGNNGAGKSTSMLLISNVISADKGTINTYNNSAVLLSINAGLMTNLSGRKNIVLLGLALGIRKKNILDFMDTIIDFSELEEFIDEPVETYSSGMRSRLGFSTALMLNTDILLVDEVLGVGDRNFKKKSTEALKAKIERDSTTAIIASHNRETILELCNKALWIDKGVGKAFGETNEVMGLYEQANNIKK